MEFTEFMVKINLKNQDYEAKARSQILQGHKDDQKDNLLMELRLKSLEEVINFKDSSLDLLKLTLEAKEKEISQLKENNNTLMTVVKNNAPEISSGDRQECLTKLNEIQTEIN